jgi:hypothetical protein
MLVREKGLLDKISPLLARFKKFKTHRPTNKDRANYTENLAVQLCIDSVQGCTHAAPAKYSPTGLATVFLNKQEMSEDLEYSLRTAVSSTDLH